MSLDLGAGYVGMPTAIILAFSANCDPNRTSFISIPQKCFPSPDPGVAAGCRKIEGTILGENLDFE